MSPSLPIHPTSLSAPWCPYVSSLYLCLCFYFANKVISAIFSRFHICVHIKYFSVFLLLHFAWQSLGLFMSLQMDISFLLVPEYCIIYMYPIFIRSYVKGHLGCFHVLAIVNILAMNIGVHVFLWIMIFSKYMFRN